MEKFDNREFNSVGSSRIRARWLLNYWPEAEEYVIGRKYEVLIYQKVYWDTMLENFEGIQILDLCDPDWLEGKPVFEYIDLVDAVTTSTEALAEYIRKLRPNGFVQCVPDRIYIPEHQPVKTEHIGPLKNLAWFGYSHNAHYLISTFDELIKRDLELVFISNAPFDVPLMYRGKLKVQNVPYNYDTIFRELVKVDAVLLPVPSGDEKAKYKSNNKVLSSWAQGLPVVAVPEDLDRFMSAEERKKESELRLQEIKDKWDVKYSVDEYVKIIETIRKRRKNGGQKKVV
jgi:hypothetical protein